MTSPEREAAVQRLAEKMLHRFHSASPFPLTWHGVAARIAAEEIERAVKVAKERCDECAYMADVVEWAQVCPEPEKEKG